MQLPADLTFLALPGEIADWRMILLIDAAADAGVLDALPGTASELAGKLDLDAHSLRVLLDALGAWDVVERRAGGRYLPGGQAPGPDALVAIRHHARAVRRWTEAIDDRLRGVTLDEKPPTLMQPELFHDALAATARKVAPHIVDLCLARFPDAKTVLDLGGLHGEYSMEFARRGLRATMQDMPRIIEVVEKRGRVRAAGVELFARSFFEAVPEGPFDLVFCCGINHTFDGEHNKEMFRRLRGVVAPGGGLALVTFFRNRHPLADVFAVQMLLNASGGDSHGEEEYRAWLGEAGFSVDDQVVDVPGRPQSALFAY